MFKKIMSKLHFSVLVLFLLGAGLCLFILLPIQLHDKYVTDKAIECYNRITSIPKYVTNVNGFVKYEDRNGKKYWVNPKTNLVDSEAGD